MSTWRQKAVELFPEMVDQFEEVDTPYLLWSELLSAFFRAYEQVPRDESLIRRIYNYSDWCCDQPGGETASDHLPTCVSVSFYEHIPTHTAAREDMPRWWMVEDISAEPSMFRYFLSEQQFEMLKDYLTQEKHRYDRSLRTGPNQSLSDPTSQSVSPPAKAGGATEPSANR
jgi:hypothetical protein